MDERMAFSMLNLVGREVKVTKMNGCVLTGVFCASSTGESDTASVDGFMLRYVHHVSGEKPQTEFGPRDRVKVQWDEVESVLASKAGGSQGWEASPEDVSAVNNATLHLSPTKKKVETDSKISLAKKPVGSAERDLKAVPKEWLEAPAEGTAIGKQENDNFDQFHVNESKFGVKSTYKEELYTTELDRGKVTAEQIARAERIAREIESSGSSNPHLLEERGKKPLEDTWDDEEAKYGAVLGSGGFEKYKPPAKRGTSNQGSLVKPAASPPPVVANNQSSSVTAPLAPSVPPVPNAQVTTSAIPVKAPATSYASMVRGNATAPAAPPKAQTNVTPTTSPPATASSSSPPATVSSGPPPLQVKKATAAGAPLPSALSSSLSKKTEAGKTVVINAVTDKDVEKKKREDEIRKFREFSQSYVSPSSKPSKSRGSPPTMNLEASPARKPVEAPVVAETKKEEDKPAVVAPETAAPTVAATAPSADTTPSAADDASKKQAKKALNPNAKNFNPAAPAYVPPAATTIAYSVPQQTVVMVPQSAAMAATGAMGNRPRYVPMPPPPVIPFQPGMFQAPPMGGYVMPVQVPYNPSGRPMMYYPPPPPQMLGQPMLIQVPYPSNLPAPPPPMPQMIQMPPPASPQQQARNPPAPPAPTS